MEKWAALVIGSIIGGVGRFLLTGLADRAHSTRFPAGTLAVNLIGCFLIGFLYYFSSSRFHLHPPSRLFLITGFCGAFTTFSAFMLEISHLLKGGQPGLAAVYLGTSLVFGFGLFELGALVGQRL